MAKISKRPLTITLIGIFYYVSIILGVLSSLVILLLVLAFGKAILGASSASNFVGLLALLFFSFLGLVSV